MLLHLIYPSPVIDVLGPRAAPAAIKAGNRLHGFDRPIIAQYRSQLGHLAHGSFGCAFKQNQAVTSLLLTAGPPRLSARVSLVLAHAPGARFVSAA